MNIRSIVQDIKSLLYTLFLLALVGVVLCSIYWYAVNYVLPKYDNLDDANSLNTHGIGTSATNPKDSDNKPAIIPGDLDLPENTMVAIKNAVAEWNKTSVDNIEVRVTAQKDAAAYGYYFIENKGSMWFIAIADAGKWQVIQTGNTAEYANCQIIEPFGISADVVDKCYDDVGKVTVLRK